MALAERMLNARFGDDLVDHYTYVLAGDGCLMEGISHEAISLAGHLRLSKLIVLWDDNSISIDGPTDLSVSDDQLLRFKASNWDVQSVDGHDQEAIATAIENARRTDRPSMIACRSIIGFGAPNKAGTADMRGATGSRRLPPAASISAGRTHRSTSPRRSASRGRRPAGAACVERTGWEARLEAVGNGDEDRVPACHGRRSAGRL